VRKEGASNSRNRKKDRRQQGGLSSTLEEAKNTDRKRGEVGDAVNSCSRKGKGFENGIRKVHGKGGSEGEGAFSNYSEGGTGEKGGKTSFQIKSLRAA